ncbi:hypothetical protein SDC9_158363 [bioreactor metagenome]|uniref:Uncharacterized protein n=1 Tax=bioreactor metagenome TaxID=1076179 RepID=A0A645FBW8_9ZZZZ
MRFERAEQRSRLFDGIDFLTRMFKFCFIVGYGHFQRHHGCRGRLAAKRAKREYDRRAHPALTLRFKRFDEHVHVLDATERADDARGVLSELGLV